MLKEIVLTAIVVALLLQSFAAAKETLPWSAQMKEANQLSRSGKTDKAEGKLREALTLATQANATVPQLAAIYQALAKVDKRISWDGDNAPKDPSELYRTIIALYESRHQPVDRLLVDAHFELGEKHLDRKDDKSAWVEFAKAIELSQNAKDVSDSSRGLYLQIFAVREQSAGKYKEADEHFKQFISASKGGGGSWHYERGMFRYLLNFHLQGHYIEAAPVFKTALALWSRSNQSEKAQNQNATGLVFLGDSANDIGYALLAAGKNAEAAAMLEDAVRLREKLERFSKTNTNTRKQSGIDMSISLVGLGKSYANLGQLDKAAPILERAYKLRSSERQPFVHSYGELIDACARFQRAHKAVTPSEMARVYKLYGKESFDGRSKIGIYLEAVRRLEREGCWEWWDWHHIPIFLKLAETEASKLRTNDFRKICLALEVAGSKRGTSSEEDALKYELKVLDSMPQIDATTLSAYFDVANNRDLNDHERIKPYEAQLDWLQKHKQFPSISTKIAKEYLAALTKTRWSRRSIGEAISKRFEMLSNALGENSPEVINVLPDIAEEHEHHHRYYDAMMCYRRIVEVFKKQYGSSPKTKQAIMKYSELLAQTNDPEGAEQARKEATAM